MKTYLLKDLLKIKNGKDHKHLADGVIPVYGSGGFMRYVDQYIYNQESILLPRKGTLSNIQYTNQPFWSVDTLYYTVINKDLCNPYFLYNYLISLNLENLNSGTGVPSMTFDSYYGLKIKLPSLNIQNKVAEKIAAISNKIEINNQLNDNLEQMAKAIYDYWFVQFDFPDENGKPYKSSGGKMVYNEVLKRQIPKGWEVTVFNNWIETTKTGDWGKESIEGNYTERVYCVRGADINGLNGKGDVKSPQRFILRNNLFKTLKPNDFIIEISGGSPTQSTARIALLTNQSFERFDSNVICSNFCKAISLKDEKYVFNFLQEWQRLYEIGIFFGFEGKTSGIKNFLFESFMDSHNVVMPLRQVVEQYFTYAESLEKKKQSNLKQNQELTKLRDWLLPMLMNGQVTVK
jgi:type I restriction enzyme S subunit